MILWSDDDLLVVNKPAGLLTVEDGYDASLPTLVKILSPAWGRLWVVHRLDKDTSGILLLARNPEAHRILNASFRERQIHKVYHAFAHGLPPWDELVVDQPLRIDGDRRHRTVIDPADGKPAQTHLKVLQRFERVTLLQASPLTGYTHQIRAHCATAGFPLLADPLYWIPKAPRPIPDPAWPITRTALHAWSIEFFHPLSGEALSLSAPYPVDFSDTLAILSLGSLSSQR